MAAGKCYSPETFDLVGNIPISTYSVSSEIPCLKPIEADYQKQKH